MYTFNEKYAQSDKINHASHSEYEDVPNVDVRWQNIYREEHGSWEISALIKIGLVFLANSNGNHKKPRVMRGFQIYVSIMTRRK